MSLAGGESSERQSAEVARSSRMDAEPSSSATDKLFVEMSAAATSKELPVLGRLFRKHLRRSVYGRTKIQSVFKQFADGGRQKVRDIIAARKESGGTFAMSTDDWKTKGRRKRSYLAVLLHYVDADFQLKELTPLVTEEGESERREYLQGP